MQYDIRGSAGNVFCVLGMLKNAEKDFRKNDCIEVADKCKDLLGCAFDMMYDDILDEIEKITNGSIEFIGRNRKDEEDADDYYDDEDEAVDEDSEDI